ncbi:hypothetical protein [Nostoc sp. CMAA1605]|uniref:hypothetical protein n=1 Tax=Nostoc sp. CMAA1605 TaxID=2055159 RepID=UPI001F2E63D1|nr:hypothetical protein [Nostoc sp. CMAA1605]
MKKNPIRLSPEAGLLTQELGWRGIVLPPTPLHPYTPIPLHPYTPTPLHPSQTNLVICKVCAIALLIGDAI